MTDTRLQGVGVLVTRPRAQAAELIKSIEDHGGRAICFPVIEIVPRDSADVEADAIKLPKPDIAVFVSSNAVAYGLSHADDAIKVAIGPATAAAIKAAGQSVDISPAEGYDSESLLQEPALQSVGGKHVRIIRGGKGRELLTNTLRERGAFVDHLSVYDRQLPDISTAALDEVETAWLAGQIDAVTVMSVETLNNLACALPKSMLNDLQNVTLVTPAARVIKEVQDRFPASKPVLASGVLATDMVDAIMTIHRTDLGQAP